MQIGTTKGTGGDVLVLEEAAYCDEGFFYETVAPILSVGSASLVAISTLTSEINFYTRLIKMRDPSTDRPLFQVRCIELACEQCKEDGKAHECVHMLHLVPRWQSQERHRKLKIMVGRRALLLCVYVACALMTDTPIDAGSTRSHPVRVGWTCIRLAPASLSEKRRRNCVQSGVHARHTQHDGVVGGGPCGRRTTERLRDSLDIPLSWHSHGECAMLSRITLRMCRRTRTVWCCPTRATY